MADKELRVPFEEIRNPQSITDVNRRKFKERDLDMHKHEVVELIDDEGRKERILKVRKRTYIDMGKKGVR